MKVNCENSNFNVKFRTYGGKSHKAFLGLIFFNQHQPYVIKIALQQKFAGEDAMVVNSFQFAKGVAKKLEKLLT